MSTLYKQEIYTLLRCPINPDLYLKGSFMNGFVNLIKPQGISSAYAVGAVKKKFACPCGHMGTLDPMASGVLPVGVGHASRLFRYMLEKSKTYVADFKFGISTDTLDVTGIKDGETDFIPREEQIKNLLNDFTGEIEQIPPRYSAKCVEGKRGYQLARKGVDFTLSPKKVTVKEFRLIGRVFENEYRFTITCGGGTYIRSLARDLGIRSGSLAVMSRLVRTASGVFDIEKAVDLEEFIKESDLSRYLLPADVAVDFPKLVLDKARANKILNGVYENHGYADGTYRVYSGSEFWGVGVAREGILKIEAYVR